MRLNFLNGKWAVMALKLILLPFLIILALSPENKCTDLKPVADQPKWGLPYKGKTPCSDVGVIACLALPPSAKSTPQS